MMMRIRKLILLSAHCFQCKPHKLISMELREIFFFQVRDGVNKNLFLSDLINRKNVSIKALKFAHIVEKCKRGSFKALKPS